MPKLILYAATPESVPRIRCSPPSWAAQIALLDEAVAHELCWLRFDQEEHRSERMLAVNPAGTVPVLVAGGDVLTDTVGILERIVEESPARRLAMSDPKRLVAAQAVKAAGMQTFRAILRGEAGDLWQPLRTALGAWQALTRTPGDAGFDLAALLVFVYLRTARSLGFVTSDAPELEVLDSMALSRHSVIDSWPATWPPPTR